MRKFRFLALVFGILLSVSGYAQTETRGHFFFSTGFSYGIFDDRELYISDDFTLLQLNAIKFGIGWEAPAGPGLASIGAEAGYSSGSRFGGRGGVDHFPINLTATYAFPLAPILYIGPSLKLGTLIKSGAEWNRAVPFAGGRLEMELRSLFFPFGLYVAGGVDVFVPFDHDPSMLPAIEVGLRFPRGRLQRRERPAPVAVVVPPPAVRPQAIPPPPPVVAPPVVAPPEPEVIEVPPPEPEYIPIPIPSRVGYTDDGRQGVLHPLFFVPGTTTFLESSIPIMDTVGRRLVANPEIRVLVRAFAVPEGSDEFRFLLSVNRSRVIRDYFIRHFGITPARIIIEAYGTDRVLQREVDDWEPYRCAELLVFEN